MHTIRNAIFLSAGAFATAAFGQSPAQPLNLQLPPGIMPAAAGTTANLPSSRSTHDAHGNPSSAPGVYYGDTSGRAGNVDTRAAAQRCDDATYNQPHTHGSVSMGMLGGNHVSGNYQAGSLSVTKNLGDCTHPAGSVGFSVNVGQSRLHGRGW